MENSLGSALLLLLIGMITVFLILSLVVLSGNILIKLINRFFVPEKVVESIPLNPSHVAIISAAVAQISKGRVKSIKIEKYEEK